MSETTVAPNAQTPTPSSSNEITAERPARRSPHGRSALAKKASTTVRATAPAQQARRRQGLPARPLAPMAGSRPRPIVPTSMEEAMALARAVVAARLAPRGLDTPEACMIAILHGLEVGLTPLSALQRIAVIDGRPTIWGDGALALVRASGLLVSIEETVTGHDEFGWVAACTVQRRGDPEPLTRHFSVADAIRALLWRRPGPWTDYPRRMLQMRARAFALRDAFPDVLGGLYLREELEGARRDGLPPVASPAAEHSGAMAAPAPDLTRPDPECRSDDTRVPATEETGSGRQSQSRRDAYQRRRPTLLRGGTWRRLGEVARPLAAGLAPRTAPPTPEGPVAPGPDAPEPAPEPWLTGRDLLTDYDNALCCAQDRDTLDEIAEEFSLVIERLGEDDRFAAGRVLARHEERVIALEKGETA
ncbi:hypothetical protein WDZ92_11570 [Nostoc sp. NIES-2111]